MVRSSVVLYRIAFGALFPVPMRLSARRQHDYSRGSFLHLHEEKKIQSEILRLQTPRFLNIFQNNVKMIYTFFLFDRWNHHEWYWIPVCRRYLQSMSGNNKHAISFIAFENEKKPTSQLTGVQRCAHIVFHALRWHSRFIWRLCQWPFARFIFHRLRCWTRFDEILQRNNLSIQSGLQLINRVLVFFIFNFPFGKNVDHVLSPLIQLIHCDEELFFLRFFKMCVLSFKWKCCSVYNWIFFCGILW